MYAGRDWASVREGDKVDEVTLPISYDMIAGLVYASRDWFPGHHNPDYARAQGKETIYANTVFLQGFLDRVALSWAGPGWFVRRRTLKMIESVYPGQTLVGRGCVTALGEPGADLATIALSLEGEAAGRIAIKGEVTLAAPLRPAGA